MDTLHQSGELDLVRKFRSMPAKRQRALLALLRKQGVDVSAFDVVPRLPRSADTPPHLSFAQRRLWFLAQLDGADASYNIPMALRLRGRLDRDALLRALEAVVQRHEVLRTRLVSHDGVPYQHIGDGSDFAVREEELADPAELPLICEREALAPFDLAHDPLIRVRLLRRSEREHVLLVTMHHSVSDGWSVGVFFRDTAAFYEAFRAGRAGHTGTGGPAPLEPLPIQYADYADWQRQWLGNEVQARQVAYWKRQLAGVDPRLTLPTDRERPTVKTYQGSHESFACPPELLESLRGLSERYDVTLYMTLLAAYTAVLHRYTQQTDIAVGTVVANRNRIEVENLIGLFANTLVMRTDVSDDPAFPDLLTRVKKTALEAFAHQDVPFEAVVESLQAERSLAHSPVFQTMFVLQEERTGRESKLGEVEVTLVDFDFDITKFDLTLELRETPDGLTGVVEYNTDLYDRETIQRFIGHYTTLLTAVTADPEEKISRLSLLDAAERRRVLVEWNEPPVEAGSGLGSVLGERCVHEWFEEVVAGSSGA
ncbi:condensation domain-containing protein, partial [Streptomyces sp. NPDC018045]|uniref:condensation domain-containing protein n=1 Tax=Streptomyces sp. NPDC018045 TaxID=3365037 RepID=UPI003796FBA6